jgi:menaquinone-dependent protoporphyrinogen oxidase
MTKEPQLHQPAANSRGGFVTVLISFATTEGQTLKIAERISLQIRERGHEVNLYDTASMTDVPEVAAFDAMIVAASVHEEHHQDSAVNFAAAHLDQLICKPSAFVSVSLSAAMPNGQAEAQHYVDRFIAATGWSPAKALLLGGALRWSECDYFQRQVLKHILGKGDVNPGEDFTHEFTDWLALQSFVDDFLASCVPSNAEFEIAALRPDRPLH